MSKEGGADEAIVGVEVVDEADRHLPVANISRIMKKVLPTSHQVSKVWLLFLFFYLVADLFYIFCHQDTKAYIQLCVSEFISFVTSEASDKCMTEKRKTINGDVSYNYILLRLAL